MYDYNFDTDDVFGRRRYGQFLVSIIQNSDSFQRADENRSYTICLDSGYGTGKSVFLKKLKTKIEADFDNNGIGVVSYNAWENDFYEDAFTPFLFSLLNDPWLDDALKADDAKGTATMAKDTLIRVGKSIAKAFVKNKLGDDAAEILQSAFEGTEKKVKGPLEDTLTEYKNFKSNIDEFNASLESCLVAWQLNKLVIIIDELDRCRPDFALRTLEITKHLMNVKNVVFIYALDKQQLHTAVKKIYGQTIDAEGYLCKFFDYITVMPRPSIRIYLPEKYSNLTGDSQTNQRLLTYMVDLCEVFMLSIRDIDTIMINYRIMIQIFLYKYGDIGAHYLYLVCLVIKYKYPALYYKIISNDQYPDPDIQSYKVRFSKNPYFVRLLDNMKKRIADKDTDYQLYGNNYKEIANVRGISSFNSYFMHYYVMSNGRWFNHSDMYPEELTSIDGIYFIEDKEEWGGCNGMTYGMYIHKKLEMFNFEPQEKKMIDL